jgi:acetyl/propionyl-CoA carboxylase alpha subunit
LLAKIIAHGATRAEATERLTRALRRLGIAGVTTNRDFLITALDHPEFAAGRLDTHFIDRHLPADARRPARDPAVDRLHAIVAMAHGHAARRAASPLPPSILPGWRNNRWRPQDVAFRVGDDTIEVRYVCTAPGRFDVWAGEWRGTVVVAASNETDGAVEIDGVRRAYTVVADGDRIAVHSALGTTEFDEVPRFPSRRGEELAGGCLAPMTGVIRDIRVALGARVEKGAVLLVLEAMKMEHQMIAHEAGVVREIRVAVGQMVDPDVVLVVVEPDRQG